MPFCKGICKDGLPCLNLTKDNFCNVHNKNYEECGICYEPIVDPYTFECNHSVCKKCMVKITTSTTQENPLCKCPFCRNTCFKNVDHYLITIINIFNIIKILETETNNDQIQDMLDYIFKHYWIIKSMNCIHEFLLDYFASNIGYILPKYYKLMRRVF